MTTNKPQGAENVERILSRAAHAEQRSEDAIEIARSHSERLEATQRNANIQNIWWQSQFAAMERLVNQLAKEIAELRDEVAHIRDERITYSVPPENINTDAAGLD